MHRVSFRYHRLTPIPWCMYIGLKICLGLVHQRECQDRKPSDIDAASWRGPSLSDTGQGDCTPDPASMSVRAGTLCFMNYSVNSLLVGSSTMSLTHETGHQLMMTTYARAAVVALSGRSGSEGGNPSSGRSLKSLRCACTMSPLCTPSYSPLCTDMLS